MGFINSGNSVAIVWQCVALVALHSGKASGTL